MNAARVAGGTHGQPQTAGLAPGSNEPGASHSCPAGMVASAP